MQAPHRPAIFLPILAKLVAVQVLAMSSSCEASWVDVPPDLYGTGRVLSRWQVHLNPAVYLGHPAPLNLKGWAVGQSPLVALYLNQTLPQGVRLASPCHVDNTHVKKGERGDKGASVNTEVKDDHHQSPPRPKPSYKYREMKMEKGNERKF